MPKTKKTTKDEEIKTISKTKGIPMSEESYKEWQKAFTDIEESIEQMDLREEKENPNAKYLRMKQQDLF